MIIYLENMKVLNAILKKLTKFIDSQELFNYFDVMVQYKVIHQMFWRIFN